MGQKHHEVIHSDSDSDYNPSYSELQNYLEEMHGDAVKAFKKISAQNKVIFKLEAELLKLWNSFESLKDNHASWVNEHIVMPSIDPPKYDSNWMDFF